jgi:hypothetical protein
MKMSKKITVFSLTTALLLSSISPVLAAEGAALPIPTVNTGPAAKPISSTDSVTDSTYAITAKISKERAIELAKSYVQIPDTYTLQGISFGSSSFGSSSSAWNLQYGKKDSDKYYGNINVSINADSGKLLNYSYNDNDPANKPAYPPKVSLTAAKEIAEQLLKKFNPTELNNVKYNNSFEKSFKPPLNGDVRYTFQYDRTENNIPFQGNFISLTLDGNGKLVNYNQEWSATIKFADPSKAISLEDATKIFNAKSIFYLAYITPWNNNKKQQTKPMLGYNLASNSVDALTGEVKNQNGSTMAPNITPLTDKALAEKPSANLNLMKEQAIKKAAEYFTLPANAELQEAYYNENISNEKVSIGVGNGVSSWSLNWSIPAASKADAEYISAGINSQTGELLNYYRSNNRPIPVDSTATEPASKISIEKAKSLATDFVKKTAPQYTDQLALDEQNLSNLSEELIKQTPAINVSFRRVIQGIVVENESVNVGINTETGEINSYWSNLSTMEYPAIKPVVLTDAKALELLLSQYTIELNYVLPIVENPIKPLSATKEMAQEAKPYYMLIPKYPDQAVFLDAISGEWRKRDTGEITTLEKTVVTDIAGHWGQAEIQLMVDYNALDVKNGKVLPDQAITRGEMIKMLIISMNGGSGYGGMEYSRASSFKDVSKESAYFPYVESAVDARIIDPGTTKTFNPDGKINRDEMAQLIVRALGYDKLAEYSELFKLDLKDSAKIKHKGQVAIVVGLGILTAANGSFMPEQDVTRAQAAIAFSRYLQKRSVLQDVPLSVGMGRG